MNACSDKSACEIRFQPLFHEGRALSFLCDETGHVTRYSLSERARRNFLYARAVIGREYACSCMLPSHSH